MSTRQQTSYVDVLEFDYDPNLWVHRALTQLRRDAARDGQTVLDSHGCTVTFLRGINGTAVTCTHDEAERVALVAQIEVDP
jgi:hypothetical protein